MQPWVECPEIVVDLDRPVRERYADVPQAELDRGARLLRELMAEIPRGVTMLADLVRLRTRGRFHEESKALAERIGTSWREVMISNLAYDLALSDFGCSSLAVATSRGPALARNMDWAPEDVLAQTSCIVRTRRHGELVFANAGWPGSIGVVTGLSGHGFALALNAVLGPEPAGRTGYPVLLHLRRVIEDARGFDEAVEMISEARLAAPGLITVAGTENHQRVVIERSPTRHAHRWADGDDVLVATNHYRQLFVTETRDDAELYRTTCDRYDNLCSFFQNHRGEQEVTDETLLYRLTDPGVIQDITAQHVIMRPRQQSIRMFVPRRFVPNGF